MNIFFTHPSPFRCATALDDRRVNKMLIESAQMLSTVIHTTRPNTPPLPPNLYKATHQNHPCTRWAAASIHNFFWLLQHAYYLAREHHLRHPTRPRHKTHDVVDTIYVYYRNHMHPELATQPFHPLPSTPYTTPPPCVPEDILSRRAIPNDPADMPTFTVQAYRDTLRCKWKTATTPPTWSPPRQPPAWISFTAPQRRATLRQEFRKEPK